MVSSSVVPPGGQACDTESPGAATCKKVSSNFICGTYPVTHQKERHCGTGYECHNTHPEILSLQNSTIGVVEK